jgi:hypothetical protein
MKFLIERTSNNEYAKQPCPEAYAGYIDGDWVVHIEDLDDLIDFVKRYGNIIISAESSYNTLPTIEIYDDYRE